MTPNEITQSVCSCCGATIETDDYYTFDGNILCDDCYHSETVECSHCGDSKRYFCVELEIDEGGKSSDNADTLLDIGNRIAEHIYIKSDGSLSDGMEIVTHPMSLKYHKNEMPWAEVMKSAIHMYYRSHKTSTCGLHVHVNRTSFGATREAQDECISRVLYFVEHHWLELLKFSRWTEYQMNRWAARYGYKNSPKEILEDAKKGCNGRYACVNITNYHTIEFRMF